MQMITQRTQEDALLEVQLLTSSVNREASVLFSPVKEQWGIKSAKELMVSYE
jgi:hypothetical protein